MLTDIFLIKLIVLSWLRNDLKNRGSVLHFEHFMILTELIKFLQNRTINDKHIFGVMNNAR